ncbi:hypothetical protein CEK25_004621 [Fusarium fujikuroi]|nr:hypothetical protein CEK25_004621 [Fusarium fujikuroi]
MVLRKFELEGWQELIIESGVLLEENPLDESPEFNSSTNISRRPSGTLSKGNDITMPSASPSFNLLQVILMSRSTHISTLLAAVQDPKTTDIANPVPVQAPVLVFTNLILIARSPYFRSKLAADSQIPPFWKLANAKTRDYRACARLADSNVLVDFQALIGESAQRITGGEEMEPVNIYDVIRDLRVQRFRVRFYLAGLEDYIDEEGALIAELSAATASQFEISTDTIELLDDIRYYLDDRFRYRFAKDAGAWKTLDGEEGEAEFAAVAINKQIRQCRIDGVPARLKHAAKRRQQWASQWRRCREDVHRRQAEAEDEFHEKRRYIMRKLPDPTRQLIELPCLQPSGLKLDA